MPGADEVCPPEAQMPPVLATRLAKDQGVVEVSGGGFLLNGLYVELHPSAWTCPETQAAAFYRRMRTDGSWADVFLLYDSGASRWCLTDAPWSTQKPRAFSGRTCPDTGVFRLPLNPWNAQGWCCSSSLEGASEIAVSFRSFADLSSASRRVAKDIFKEPRRFTPFRSTADSCPHICHREDAKDWGFESEAVLYGHICMYHRSSPQYYDKCRRYWDQSVANALNERSESQESLLMQFEEFMHGHNYEDKTTTLRVKTHCSRLLHVAQKLKVPLSRQLTGDPAVFEQVAEFPEDKSSHKHFTNSLRWFKKWVEISVIEEVLANAVHLPSGDEQASPSSKLRLKCAAGWKDSIENADSGPPLKKTKFDTQPVGKLRPPASPARAARTISDFKSPSMQTPSKSILASSPLEENDTPVKLLRKRRKCMPPELTAGACVASVAVAADPFVAILQTWVLSQAEGQVPAVNLSSVLLLPKADAPALSKYFACLAVGDRVLAEKCAAWEEREGPCRGVFAPNMTETLRYRLLSRFDEDDLDHVWLWAYCGVRDRTAVLTSLSKLFLQGRRGDGGVSQLLTRLSSISCSPHIPPTDVIMALDVVLKECPGTAPEASFKLLEIWAKKRFFPSEAMLNCLWQPKWSWSVKLAMLGAILGKALKSWVGTADVSGRHGRIMQAWWITFKEIRPSIDEQDRHNRAAFASGFHWNWDVEGAQKALQDWACSAEAAQGPGCCTDFRTLQTLAQEAAKNAAERSILCHGDLYYLMEKMQATVNKQHADLEAAINTVHRVESKTELGEELRKKRRLLKMSAKQKRNLQQASKPLQASLRGLQRGHVKAVRHRSRHSRCKDASSEETEEDSLPMAVVPVAQVASGYSETQVQEAPAASIRELDDLNVARPLRGTVQSRSEHTNAGCLHLRVADSTGEIDVKFWGEAARAFRHHAALRRGAQVRLAGFKFKELKTLTSLAFAPAGRSHELFYDVVHGASVEEVQVSVPQAVASPEVELGLEEALSLPAETHVSISAFVVDLDAPELKCTQDGKEVMMRVAWLARGFDPAALRTRWCIWNLPAYESVFQRLDELMLERVHIRGVRVKEREGKKELMGCWTEGGVEVVPS